MSESTPSALSDLIRVASSAARARAAATSPGPRGLLYNTLASQLALMAAAADGIEGGAGAPGVGAAPTGQAKLETQAFGR